MLIKKADAKVVDLTTKVIRKYTAPDKKLEINHIAVNGRHPDNPNHFIIELGVDFMVFGLHGHRKVYVNQEIYEIDPGDVVYVARCNRFAAEGTEFEYLAVETPAWYPGQGFVVDSNGAVVEDTTV